jgi:hypothetical protein
MFQSDSTPAADADCSFLKSLGWASPRLVEATLATLPANSLPTDLAQRERWLLYTLLQQAADDRTLNALAWANDERAEDFLDTIVGGTLPTEFTELARWLKHLPGNRAQKHARRRRLLRQHRHDLRRPALPSPEAVAEQADELAAVRRTTSDREWELLNRVAADSLGTVAVAESMPTGTLKSLLSRCRHRLRMGW